MAQDDRRPTELFRGCVPPQRSDVSTVKELYIRDRSETSRKRQNAESAWPVSSEPNPTARQQKGLNKHQYASSGSFEGPPPGRKAKDAESIGVNRKGDAQGPSHAEVGLPALQGLSKQIQVIPGKVSEMLTKKLENWPQLRKEKNSQICQMLTKDTIKNIDILSRHLTELRDIKEEEGGNIDDLLQLLWETKVLNEKKVTNLGNQIKAANSLVLSDSHENVGKVLLSSSPLPSAIMLSSSPPCTINLPPLLKESVTNDSDLLKESVTNDSDIREDAAEDELEGVLSAQNLSGNEELSSAVFFSQRDSGFAEFF